MDNNTDSLWEKRKQRTHKVADRITQTIKDGILSVKSVLNESEKKKGTASQSGSSAAKAQIELLRLSFRQAELDKQYQKNRCRLMEYKQCEAGNEYIAELDTTVRRAYYRSGGIRFHIEKLSDNIEFIDPVHDDVCTMVVRCYNSAIVYMYNDVNKLIKEYDEQLDKLKGAQELFSDDASLKKALGYTDCSEQIRLIQNVAGDRKVAELKRLSATMDANEQRLTDYLKRCKEGISRRQTESSTLLSDLKRLLNQETTSKFATTEGWNPLSYHTAVTQFSKALQKELFEKYPLA